MKTVSSVIRDHIQLPQSFPITITQTVGVSPAFQRLHWHNTLEINYIHRGRGYYLINGNRYEFKEGDILFINSNDLHRAFETEELIIGIIMFDPAYLALEQRYDAELLNPFREVGRRFDNLLDRDRKEIARLRAIITDMDEEYRSKEPHYEVIVRAQLLRLLGLVNRYFDKGAAEKQLQTRGMEAIRGVLHEVEMRMDHPWTLKELADRAHLSPSRFSALFTKLVGTSPLNYLIQLRLSHAVELLEATDDKVIDIAASCGFRNLSNFNRLFKQHIGKLPSDVRSK